MGGYESYSYRLASYVTSLDLNNIPEAVVAYSKTLLLDLLGAAVAGVDTEEGRCILKACVAMHSGGGTSALWGTELQLSESLAALHNGTIAHALELDDFGGADHSGAVIIPAVMAVAGRNPNISGKRLLEAIIAGYDVSKRILDGSGGYHSANKGGWHSTGPCGSFGAAAAVAKMLDLDLNQTTNALGLAGSFTGGTWAFLADGSMSKRYHAGRAAETGIVAAYLAESGFTGPSQVLEAESGGYFNLYAPETTNLKEVLSGLGDEYRIMHAGIKPYASCRGVHSSIDTILDLNKSEGISAKSVKSINVDCSERQARQLGRVLPRTRLEAQMSLPYSIAIALIKNSATLDLYMEPWISNKDVYDVAARIEINPNPEFTGEPCLTLVTRDGDVLRRQVAFAKGAPENPLSYDEIVDKYINLASRLFSSERVQAIKDAVMSLDKGGSVSSLLNQLSDSESTFNTQTMRHPK